MNPIVMLEVAWLGLLSLAALALGFSVAYSPSRRRYEMLRPVTVAIVFAALWIMGTGLENALVGFGNRAWSAELAGSIFGGVAEMIVPGVAACAVLTAAWALAAIGLRKLE